MFDSIVRERRGRLVLLGIAAVALLLLAAGISSLSLDAGEARAVAPLNESVEAGEEGLAGEDSPFLNLDPASPFILFGVMLLTAAVIIGVIRSRSLRAIFITLAVMTVGLVILVELYERYGEPPTQDEGVMELGDLIPSGPDPAAVPDFVRQPADWITIAITAGLTAVALGAGWLIWRAWPRDPEVEKQALFSLAMDAEVTLGELRTGGDVRDTVLGAYVNMSQTLRRMDGLARGASMTPHEFEEQLVRAGLPARAVARLTRLFEQVRYGGVETGERERREAIACMETIIEAARSRHQNAPAQQPLEPLRY